MTEPLDLALLLLDGFDLTLKLIKTALEARLQFLLHVVDELLRLFALLGFHLHLRVVLELLDFSLCGELFLEDAIGMLSLVMSLEKVIAYKHAFAIWDWADDGACEITILWHLFEVLE